MADASAAPNVGRPRRPWLAAVLSFLIPGLGYLYAGFPRRAALLFLLVDGKPLKEPYARFKEPPAFAQHDAERDVRDNWGPTRLPKEMYFLLGDNRDNSRDSRHWGFVREGDFLGRAQVVHWSWDADAARARWERIGHRLE
jgi:hypothetical protein